MVCQLFGRNHVGQVNAVIKFALTLLLEKPEGKLPIPLVQNNNAFMIKVDSE
ncbi:hypothetical protein Misp06_03416 [Microbulbifer sp. NBRC 101763]